MWKRGRREREGKERRGSRTKPVATYLRVVLSLISIWARRWERLYCVTELGILNNLAWHVYGIEEHALRR